MPKISKLENHLTTKQIHQKYVKSQHSQEKKHALSLIAAGGVTNTVGKEIGMSSGCVNETVHRYNQGEVAEVKISTISF